MNPFQTRHSLYLKHRLISSCVLKISIEKLIEGTYPMDLNSVQEFGKIFASREYVIVDGVNVRNLLRDLGMLILWNTEQKGYDIVEMGSDVSCKHGKYCSVCSCLIMEYGRMKANNQKFLLGEFPHYEGYEDPCIASADQCRPPYHRSARSNRVRHYPQTKKNKIIYDCFFGKDFFPRSCEAFLIKLFIKGC